MYENRRSTLKHQIDLHRITHVQLCDTQKCGVPSDETSSLILVENAI